ncbi:hypothetical protein SAMN05192583_3712 [Sphingomonas gellani]|uniref:Uncharacterized protein n=1 Tax=Sphingomonas gellani TaxID=1166340 RepID=A0A1H8JXU4_9SPHN|nr:hypothetical protein [Sphingomonas gellani]SEN85325.1 hypothetical protein SAMN05192583_3712 [Sphingomonas gellani]
METDPLERIAVALVDEIRARKPASSTPVLLPQTSPEAPSQPRTGRKRERRVALYPAHYSLRITDEDRDRFDACAERHRLAKGELFRRMLNAFEAIENEQEK